MSPAKKSVTAQVREFYHNNPGADPKQVAARFKCHPSIAYRARAVAEESSSEKVTYQRKPNVVTVAMSLQLADLKGIAEIQLRNGTGELLGTLRLESKGIQYRRPNQKKPADRLISWNTLDKIMTLGLS